MQNYSLQYCLIVELKIQFHDFLWSFYIIEENFFA